MLRLPCFVAALCLLAQASFAQSAAFTYQGQLKSSDTPADGMHDFRFTLFDAAMDGAQIGTTQCVSDVQVVEGEFTATLDFGNQFVTPNERFLQIEVRRDNGLTCGNIGGFVVLSPRQLITAAPLATHARSAFGLDAANGSIANVVSVDNSGRVGIGPASPTHSVHVANPAPTLALQDTDSTTQQVGSITYRDSGNVERAWVGYGTAGSSVFSIVNARPGGHLSLLPLSGGDVGIGTPTPAATLDVRGDIRLGPSGQYRAAAAEENLPIVCGTVKFVGTIVRGTGFTALRLDVGKYRVTFATPFADVPTITATSTRHVGDLQVGSAALDACDPPTPSQAVLVVRVLPANDYRDSRFDFIAVGPR